MKMTSIIKTVAAVAAVVYVGKVIYKQIKVNEEIETKDTVDDVIDVEAEADVEVEDEAEIEAELDTEKSITEKISIFADSLTEEQKVICVTGLALGFTLLTSFVSARTKKEIAKEINNDPNISFMKDMSVMALKAIRMGVISYDDLIRSSEIYDREVR